MFSLYQDQNFQKNYLTSKVTLKFDRKKLTHGQMQKQEVPVFLILTMSVVSCYGIRQKGDITLCS